MIDFFKKKFNNKIPEVLDVVVPPVTMAAQPIHINISNIGSIERNKARIARLERAIEKGKGTPEILGELEARKKSLAAIVEMVK